MMDYVLKDFVLIFSVGFVVGALGLFVLYTWFDARRLNRGEIAFQERLIHRKSAGMHLAAVIERTDSVLVDLHEHHKEINTLIGTVSDIKEKLDQLKNTLESLRSVA